MYEVMVRLMESASTRSVYVYLCTVDSEKNRLSKREVITHEDAKNCFQFSLTVL